jgi:hypothetical protein
MSSFLHEVLVEMFRDRPAFAAELLARLFGFGAGVPAGARVVR